MRLPRLPLLLLLALSGYAQQPQLSDTSSPLLQRANTLLSTGQYGEAVSALSELISNSSSDPGTPDYLLYYKRATAYYSLSRYSQAIEDYTKVFSLNEGMYRVLLQEARCHVSSGQFAAARTAIRAYTARYEADPANRAQGRDKDPDAAEIVFNIAEAEQGEKRARQAVKARGWAACQAAAGEVLRVASHWTEIRELRAECEMSDGAVEEAVADYTRLSQLRPADTGLTLRLSTLTFFLLSNPTTPAISHVKTCLHSDPENAACLKAHRSLKSLQKAIDKARNLKEGGKWATLKRELDGPEGLLHRFDQEMHTAFDALQPPLPAQLKPEQLSQPRVELLAWLCDAYTRTSSVKAGEAHYRALLALRPESIEALVGLGELALENEEYDEAVRLLQDAWEAEGRPRQGDTADRLRTAQTRLKQSKQKDYYKVLGVSRDADERTVKKAYRRAAKSAHPDKAGGSETRMAAVNEAYEVLSNPELKARYDAGDDPNDPASGHGPGGGQPFFFHGGSAGGNPFQFFQQGAGSPFGQGGFQFQRGFT
ncbi:DnaJ-domain-containing protein [Calocera viscosa TUFC12733]|uniref:DnaJ-domain-containing protein n=1 Tax=Calocera viscosa (strain TUFC12733) TaxID=1330018 RepID=A0A167JQV1_CALVF|nr:DnaJ-domain-containing protein [Calocera viscosa TUFC12733]